MATQAELNQAQLLYVAYYGRPADPAGLEFWAEQIAQVGVAGIAADFGNSAEFEAEFGDMGSVALINNLYQQLFGREAEAEGLQYWLDVLADGTPLASIAFEIAGGAQGGDATGLENKVTLSNQFTAAVLAGDVAYDGVDAAAYGREFLSTINENTNVETYDVQAVVDGIESGELPVDTADLRQGLQELSDAEDALETFLVDALENEDVAAAVEARAPGAETATAADITAAASNTADDVEALVGGGFATAEANTQTGLIADERAELQGVIDTEQAELDELNASVDEVTGLRTALTNYDTALANQEEATTAAEDAQAVLTGAVGTFAARNGVQAAEVIVTDTTVTIDDGVADAIAVFTLNAQGEWEVVEGLDETTVNGLADLQTSLQAETDASEALVEANTAVTNAAETLNEVDLTDSDFTPGEGAGVGIHTQLEAQEVVVAEAQTDLDELNTAVEAWEAAAALSAELGELNTAIDDARDYLVNEEDGLGINLIEDYVGLTTDGDDVFLFAESEITPVTIADFGSEGVDRIFFGPDYSLVELAEGETINDRVGSASELEIFWNQGDTGLELFVETAVTSGNVTNDTEITSITLTGVNAEDISFTSGFLSAGTVTEVA